MLVFNNQQRSGYDEIVSYGPKFYSQIREMDAIYRFAGWTLNLMAVDLEKVIAYQFIDYMDHEALSRFERFLGIPVDETKSLEDRRTLAYANWSSSGKMSKIKISAVINAFAECDCTVSFENSVLEINMTFKADPAAYMDDIRKLLRKAIPAHIEILYKGKVDTNITFLWTSKVTIERMINRMEFHIHGSDTAIMLNGSNFLDGSAFLDNSFNLFPITISNRLEMPHSEKFSADTGFAMNFMNKSVTDQMMSLRIDVKANETIPVNTAHKIGIQHSEKVTLSLTIKNDLCYLDGNELLNGSRKVDAYIKKEDL